MFLDRMARQSKETSLNDVKAMAAVLSQAQALQAQAQALARMQQCPVQSVLTRQARQPPQQLQWMWTAWTRPQRLRQQSHRGAQWLCNTLLQTLHSPLLQMPCRCR